MESTNKALRRRSSAQISHLRQQPPPSISTSCKERYDRLWKDGVLEIDWYYGFMNAGEVIVDLVMKDELIRILTQKCGAGMPGACGFKIVGKDTLQKKISNSRKVIIRITHSTAGKGLAYANKDKQLPRTKAVWESFLKSLTTTEVVIYGGHSRKGTGPGFGPYGLQQMVAGIFRYNWKKVYNTLEDSKQQPEVIGFSSCDSDDYYLPDLMKITRRTAIAVNVDVQKMSWSDPMLFTLVDSLIVGRCQEDMNKAFASPDIGDKAMKIYDFN